MHVAVSSKHYEVGQIPYTEDGFVGQSLVLWREGRKISGLNQGEGE